MSIIQQAIDNKPLIQQIVTNLLAGKSSENIFESTGYASSDVNLPAKDFIQHLLFVWFNSPLDQVYDTIKSKLI